MEWANSGEPARDQDPDLKAGFIDAFAAEELSGIDLPHVIVCRDEENGVVSCQGPYPSGLAALSAAHRDAEIERGDGGGLGFTSYPLLPVDAFAGPDGVHWRVCVVLVDAGQVDQLLSTGVVPDLDAARTFAEQAALASAPREPGDLVVAMVEGGHVGRTAGQTVFVPEGPGARRVATVDTTGRLSAWATEPGSATTGP